MHRIKKIAIATAAATFLVLLAAVPLQATTVDEVIAKHIEARGGLDAWNEIETLKATGSFTAFSKVGPFTLHRARDNRYHLDHVLGDKPVTMGYDGETAWWVNLWYQVPWAQAISGQDLKAFMQDVDFESPFFNYREKGYQVELLGDGDLDGQKAIKVQLTRPGGAVETWYLDPDTYLELGYDAEGSDFGRPAPQRAFIEDFRKVGGVMIPHFIEKQWYTRDRIMEVEEIELGVEIDDGLFEMPLPGEMNQLQAMAGDWNVKFERRNSPEAPWSEAEMTSKITGKMGGAMLEETFVSPQGIEVVRSLSHDRFKERYRLTQFNSYTQHLDVQEGTMEDGRLIVSNAETDTSWQRGGQTVHERLSIFEIAEDGFKMESERSVDGGENWFASGKATYTRKAE